MVARRLRLPALVCVPACDHTRAGPYITNSLHQLVRRHEGALYGIMADLGRVNAVSSVLSTVKILA